MTSKNSEYHLIKKLGDVILTRDITNMGLHRSVLKNLVDDGLIIKLERGIYIKSDAFEDEFLVLQSRYKKGVFSDETALFLLGFSDRTPAKFNMTFPKGYNATSLKNENVLIRKSIPKLYNTGITEITSPYGNKIKTYNIEKTICDVLRGSSSADVQVVLGAIKKYSKSKDKDINKLLEYANLLRVKDKILNYMEVLL